MRTWILLSTLTLALPLTACGDDTGGSGGGGSGGGDAASTGDTGTTTTTADASSGSGTAGPVEVIEPCDAAMTPDAEITNAGMTAFSPTTATIPAGGIVRFASTGPHNMTALDGSWGTTTSAPEACIRFNEAGTYDFECTVHPAMTGTITVE